MKKVDLAIIVFFLILFSVLGLRFILGGSEDAWVCDQGQWVKRGAPDASMPEEPCEGGSGLLCSDYQPEECPAECVVCPPCPACSSITCQTEEFCAGMNIDRSWYEGIKKQINSFEKCVAAGNAVMESYPRKCRAGEQTFTENIGNIIEKADLIHLTAPLPNEKINSPLVVEGEARGTWFFEGDFPVVLTDWDGQIISVGVARAQGEWMTEDFVGFRAELEFDKPEHIDNGSLILRKDNPSGLPEQDDALEIPIKFE